LTEKQQIDACCRGDARAQKSLYEAYLPYVLSITRRYGVADRDTPDVVQDIFVAIFSNLDRYNPSKGALKPWLRSVAVHQILKFLRSRSKHQVVDAPPSPHLPDHSSGKLESIEAQYLVDMIARLPTQYRLVFNLYAVEGYAHREIAKQLHISVGTSRSSLSRARQLLQKEVERFQKQNADELPG